MTGSGSSSITGASPILRLVLVCSIAKTSCSSYTIAWDRYETRRTAIGRGIGAGVGVGVISRLSGWSEDVWDTMLTPEETMGDGSVVLLEMSPR